MQRLSNAWRLSKASWQVLSQDKRMIGIPILTAFGAIVAFAVIALPGLLLAGDRDNSASGLARWILVALGAIAASWCAAFGQAAIIAGAAEIMDGDAPSLRGSLGMARRRSFRLLEWAVLATGIALILDQIEQRFGAVGRIVSWLGSAAFAVLSFLALPVIVFENLGAIAAFKRSAELLKQTWGEQVAFGFGMGLLTFVLVLPAAFVGVLGLSTGFLPLQIFGVATAAAAIVLILAVTSALSAVFKAALYRYATGAPVDHAFTDEDLVMAFEPTKAAKKSGAHWPPTFAEPADSGAVATIDTAADPEPDTAGPTATIEPAETSPPAPPAKTKTAKTTTDTPGAAADIARLIEIAEALTTAIPADAAQTPGPAEANGNTAGPAGPEDTSSPVAAAEATRPQASSAKATRATGTTKASKTAKASKSTKASKTAKARKSTKATKSAKSRKSTKTKPSNSTEDDATASAEG